MVKFILLLLATLVLFLFSMGAFVAEGTVKGPAVGGRLAVRARGRTVTLQAVAFGIPVKGGDNHEEEAAGRSLLAPVL